MCTVMSSECLFHDFLTQILTTPTIQSQQIYVMDRPVFFNFSTSQEITRCVGVKRDAGMCIYLSPSRSPYGIVPGTAAGMDPTGTVPMAPEGSNNILLFTVFNPMYPITVVSYYAWICGGGIDVFTLLQEVMRTICSPYGFVQRIVVFRKNGLQVLVEYPI